VFTVSRAKGLPPPFPADGRSCFGGGVRHQSFPPPGRRRNVFGWRRPIVQVLVRDGNVDQALRALKKKMQREGIFREMKLRRNYEKPSERKAREKAEAVRRARKLLRKRLEREGY
jgi:small subunit ribosomal protein S21